MMELAWLMACHVLVVLMEVFPYASLWFLVMHWLEALEMLLQVYDEDIHMVEIMAQVSFMFLIWHTSWVGILALHLGLHAYAHGDDLLQWWFGMMMMIMVSRCYIVLHMCCQLCRFLWSVKDLLVVMQICFPLGKICCDTWETCLIHIQRCQRFW